MKVLTVIPLSRGVFKEHLTYLSPKNIAPGTLISVSVRKKDTPALVIEAKDVKDMKAELRSASYTLKKIGPQKGVRIFSEKFIGAAEEIARKYATHTGQVIQALIPKAIMEHYLTGTFNNLKIPTQQTPHKNLKGELHAFQADDTDRISTYRSFIRESFARNESVFFCVPSTKKINHIHGVLERGIEAYTYVLHGKLSKTELLSRWKSILTEEHPVLVIMTSGFLSLPRSDVETIIVDQENTRHYKTSTRPFIDMRDVAEIIGLSTNCRVVFGDMFLRTETVARYRAGELEAFAPLKFRSLSTAESLLVDMRTPTDEIPADKSRPFTSLSPNLRVLIEESKRCNEHLVLFVSRKGMHSVTVCADCGEIIQCENCSSPMTLHKRKTEKQTRTVFICHKCGTRKSTRIYCSSCQSWRLQPLGIGIEFVEDELEKEFPDITRFRLDSDTATTDKKAQSIIQSFLSSPGSILLGTEMLLTHLNKKVENVGIVTVDSLFALPDYRVHERIFNMLLHLRENATKHFLIQTRHPDTKIFDFIMTGNLLDFYRDEMKLRKELGYPPYKTFIKISRQGSKDAVTKEMQELQGMLAKYDSLIFPAFIQEIKNKYRMHALIRLDPDQWIDDELLELLRSLPPSFAVTVDPEDLL